MSKLNRGIVPLVVFLFCLLIGGAGTAYAHAGLTGVEPEKGATIDEAPAQVVFTFNEELKEPSFTAVTFNGKEVEGWSHTLEAEKLVVVPPSGDLAAGEYAVSYRVVSRDGHPIDGTTTFTLSDDGGHTADSTPATETPAAATDSSGDGEGLGGLLESPWLWGVLVVIGALVALALVRRGRGGDNAA